MLKMALLNNSLDKLIVISGTPTKFKIYKVASLKLTF